MQWIYNLIQLLFFINIKRERNICNLLRSTEDQRKIIRNQRTSSPKEKELSVLSSYKIIAYVYISFPALSTSIQFWTLRRFRKKIILEQLNKLEISTNMVKTIKFFLTNDQEIPKNVKYIIILLSLITYFTFSILFCMFSVSFFLVF